MARSVVECPRFLYLGRLFLAETIQCNLLEVFADDTKIY